MTHHVAELRTVTEDATHLHIGGAATWSDVLPAIEKHWPSFATLIRRFGSVQIRSQGTVAGNLGTASPIGDGAPSLLALGAELTLASSAGERTIVLDDYFIDYRISALKKNEIIKAISVPLPGKNQRFHVYKISKRYDQDISTVCGAFALEMDDDIIVSAQIAYGGMAAIPKRATHVESALTGRSLNEATVTDAKGALSQDFSPLTDMRGSAEYRATVAGNLIERLAHELDGETIEVMAL